MIDRRFKMEDQRRKARRSGQGDDGALTIQYTVAPIFTPGGGNEDPNDCNWNVCDASMGDGSGTGGDYGDPGFDGTYRPECEHTPNGKCVTREVNPIEWAALKPRIENINDSRPECTGAKEALRWAYDQKREAQRIRFWDGWDPEAQDDGSPGQRLGERVSDSDGPFIEYDSYWVWHDRQLLVHEGVHLYYYFNPHPTLTGPELHREVYRLSYVCSR